MTPTPDAVSQPASPKALDLVERVFVTLSATAIIVICVLITVGIVTRAAFNWTIPDAEIIVRECMIWVAVLPLSYISASKAHIAVDVVHEMMPLRLRKRLNLLASLFSLLVLLPILYGAYLGLRTSIARDAYFFGTFEIPEWPGRAAFFAGYVVFTVRLGVDSVKDILALGRNGAETPS